jgi:hypothetical protein
LIARAIAEDHLMNSISHRLATATVAAIAAGTLGFAVQPAVAHSDPKDAVATPVPQSTPATKADAGPRYCNEYYITGSILRHRECHTRAEWLKMGVDPLKPNND